MLQSKHLLFLDPRTIRSFAAVRARVKAAVAAQTKPVSLADALAQTRKSNKDGPTKP
jgi:hypothetical protein